ncbi:unnamed protein product [Microthlaspi erraticum]|uniref:Uncharacterized protein n=1 Tax=Microthlaspi erraticum TaxID=1685480 RepID=A0A6D2JLR2_9BRAS|nr:unnamed protein product [Microthlaspi erraticum]
MEDDYQLMQRFLEGHWLSIRTQCRGGVYTTRAGLVELASSIEADQRQLVGLVAVQSAVAPTIQPQSQQLQHQHRGGSFSSRSGSGRGGSTEHCMASCPRREAVQDARVCYHRIEPGRLRPMCPKLQSMAVASIQPIATQPVVQIAAVQSAGQSGSAPRGYSGGDRRD